VLEFLSRADSVIFVDADVLETLVAFQVLDTLPREGEKEFDFAVARVPDLTFVTGIFDQNLVRADRPHAVIEAIATASRLAFYMVKR
jgi:hypothetical protein